MDKKEIRNNIKKVLASYEDNMATSSKIITDKILSSNEYKNATTILTYMALRDEVNIDIERLLHNDGNKKIFIPKVKLDPVSLDFFQYAKKEDLIIGSYNILEPNQKTKLFDLNEKKENENILVLVPGRAFTKSGIRMGRGKGFYDRFLSSLKATYKKENLCFLGVCFSVQILESLPYDDFDIPMDKVLTD